MEHLEVSLIKVLLVGNFAVDAQPSMQGFLQALAAGLPDQDIAVKIVAPAPILSRSFKNVHNGVGKWLGYIDKYILFPPHLRRDARNVDLVHICDQGNGIYVRQIDKRIPLLLTCHDLFAVRAGRGDSQLWSLSRTGRIYQKLIWGGICRAQNIACVSEATRADLTRLLGFAETSVAPRNPHITCIPNGLYKSYERMSEIESQQVLQQQCDMNPTQPFLLHVGGNQAYKNRLGLLRIYAAMRRDDHEVPPIVLAGKAVTPEMRRFTAENALEGMVLERVGLSDTALRALYSQARALIFPSTMEGFGLPILEAQACGCPVFTSNRAPMMEVGGEAAVYINPENIEDAARIISQTLRNTDKLTEMAQQGYVNVSSRFTMKRMISDYNNLYRFIIENDHT